MVTVRHPTEGVIMVNLPRPGFTKLIWMREFRCLTHHCWQKIGQDHFGIIRSIGMLRLNATHYAAAAADDDDDDEDEHDEHDKVSRVHVNN